MSSSEFSNTSDSDIPLPPVGQRTRPLFTLGQIVATPAVLEHFNRHGINARDYLKRHQCGDWGEVCPDDAEANHFDVTHGLRILSAYTIAGATIWIITEADRSSSCLLFPGEY